MSNLSILRIIFIVYLLLSRINVFGYNLHGLSVTIPMSIFALFTILLYIKKYYGNYKKLLNKYVIIPFLFIVLCVLTSYINVGRIPFFNVVSNIIIFYLLLLDEKTNFEKHFISKILVYSISTVSIISLIFAMFEKIGFLFFDYTSFFQQSRFIGVIRFYDAPNGVAIISFLGFVLSLYYFENSKKLYSFFSLSNLIVLLWTGSRSTLLALISFILIILIFLFNKYRKKISKKHIFISFSTFLVISALSIYFITVDRIDIIKGFSHVDTNNFLDLITNYRYSMYKEAFILGIKSPLIGNGLNTFVSNSKLWFKDNSFAAIFTGENPHNIFLALFYYTGIIGLVLGCLIFYAIFKNNIKIIKNNHVFKNYCIFGLIIGIFMFSILDVNILFHVQITGYIFWYYCLFI